MKKLIVRYSELATLGDCMLKYKLGYADGLVGEGKPRLALGSAFHALMEGHYIAFREMDAEGVERDLTRARQAAAQKLVAYRATPDGQLIDDEMWEQLKWMYDGYVERYGADLEWTKIGDVEDRRIVPLVSHLGVRVHLAVTADLIVYNSTFGRWLLVDHKTLSGRDAGKAATSKENQLDPQRKLYVASYSTQGPKKGRLPLFSAYHSVIRTDRLKRDMLPEERFGRSPIYFTEAELNNAWEEAKNLARDAVEIRLGRGRAKRMYSSPNPLECSWKCQFKEVHLTANATARDPKQVAIDYGFRPAEPGNEFIGVLEESA